MRTLCIVNPRSNGGRTQAAWPLLERRISDAIGPVDAAFTNGPLAATVLAQRALGSGYGRIVAVGGDGTLNEVINGFFLSEMPINREALLGFVMSGTGGDFRKTLEIPADAAAHIERLAQAQPRLIDVGRVSFVTGEGKPAVRHFVNIGSFGLSGAVVRQVNRARVTKLMGGKFAFFWNSLVAAMRYRDKPVRVKVDDVFDAVIPVSTVAVANGRYFGGGMKVAPDADPFDGLFDVVMMKPVPRGRMMSELGKLYSGGHVGSPHVHIVRGKTVIAAPVEETRGRAVELDLDGEAPGRLPARFEIVPKIVRLLA